MCKYCEKKDEWDRLKQISKEKHKFGVRAYIENEVALFFTDADEGFSAELNFSCCVGGHIEQTIADMYIPIKFCPFCGRKLTLPDEEVEECPKQENTTP